MTEPTDIRSLLTTRSRARVTPRNNSLIGKRPATDPPEVDESASEEEIKSQQDAVRAQIPDLSTLQKELENLPQAGKRLAVHLEQNVRSDLLQLCDHHELTPEIFIEAALALMNEKPELTALALKDARGRLAQRKRAGLLRRTIAMAQKYTTGL